MRRSLCAVFLGLVVLAGGVEIHPAGEILDAGGLTQVIFQPAARHCGRASHIEAAVARQIPACPACLAHLRTGGVHHASVIRPERPLAAGRLVAQAPPTYERQAVILHSSRGPPSA